MAATNSAGGDLLARPYAPVVLVICVNALVSWALFTLTRNHLDYSDMVENYAWGISWAWGNNKHPPLFGWITAAWFAVFPRTDGAYYLLSAINLATAFGFLALAMRRFLSPRHIFVAVVLTLLFTRFGLDAGYKYNANAGQYPFITGFLWALLNGVATRRDRWWVASGLFIAGAVLCKYSAAVLIVAMAGSVWLMLRPSFATVLRGGLIALVVAGAAVAPHIWWEIRHQWPSLAYLRSDHTAISGRSKILVALEVLRDVALFSALPLAVWVGLRFQPGATAKEPPQGPPRIRMGLAVYAFCVGTTFLASWVQNVDPVTAWFIVPSLFLGWALVDLVPDTRDWEILKRRMAWVYIIYVAAMAALAGVLLYHQGAGGMSPSVLLQRKVALDAAATFQSRYGGEAAFAAGDFPLPYAYSFYVPGRTQSLSGLDPSQSQWIDKDAFARGSRVVLCGNVDEEGTVWRDSCAERAVHLYGQPDMRQDIAYTVPGEEEREQNRRYFTIFFYPAAGGGV